MGQAWGSGYMTKPMQMDVADILILLWLLIMCVCFFYYYTLNNF